MGKCFILQAPKRPIFDFTRLSIPSTIFNSGGKTVFKSKSEKYRKSPKIFLRRGFCGKVGEVLGRLVSFEFAEKLGHEWLENLPNIHVSENKLLVGYSESMYKNALVKTYPKSHNDHLEIISKKY